MSYFYQHKTHNQAQLEDAATKVNAVSPITTSAGENTKEGYVPKSNEASILASREAVEIQLSQEKQLKLAQGGTVMDTVDAVGDLAYDTVAANVYNHFKYDNAFLREPDEAFRKDFGDDQIEVILKQYKLGADSYPIIKDAVSLEHANDLATWEKKKHDALTNVQSNLTSSEQLWYGLAAEVVTDPTTLIGGVAFSAVKALSKANKLSDISRKSIAGFSAGMDVGYGATVGLIDEDMSMLEALTIYTTIGAIDYKVVNSASKFDKMSAKEASKDAKTQGEADSFIKQDALREQVEAGAKVERNINERNMKMSDKLDLEDELSGMKPTDKGYKALSKKIAKLDAEIAKLDIPPTKTLTTSEQEYLKYSLEVSQKAAKSIGFRQLTEIAKKIKAAFDISEGAMKSLSITIKEQVEAGAKVKRNTNERNMKMSDKLDLEDKLSGMKPTDKGYEALSKKMAKLDDDIAKLDIIPTKTLTISEQEYLRYSLEVSQKAAKSIGFRQLSETAKKIRGKFHISDGALALLNTTIRDLKVLGVDIEMSISEIKNSIKVHAKTDLPLAEDIVNVYRDIYKAGYISKSAMDGIEASFKKGSGKGFNKPKIEITPTKNGKGSKIKINGKIVAVVGASAIAVPAAEAAETSTGDDIAVSFGLFIVAGILGIGVASKLKSTVGKTMFEKSSNIVKSMRNSDNTRSMRTIIGETASKSRTILNETIEPMVAATKNTPVAKIAGDFYFNPLDSVGSTIEIIKRQLANTKYLGMSRELNDPYIAWLKDGKVSKFAQVRGLFESLSWRTKFNKEIFEYIELGMHKNNPHIVEATNITQRYAKSMAQDMIDVGVKGADKMFKASKLYIPRLIDHEGFINKIAGIRESDYDKIVKALARTLTKTKDPEGTARIYIDSILDSGSSSKSFSKEGRAELEKSLASKGLSPDEIDSVLEDIGGQYGRTKARLDMDYSKFGTVNVKHTDGTTSKIGYGDLFVTDTQSVFAAFFNSASGHVAMAQKGYTSIDDLLGVVENSMIKSSYKKTLINDIQATVGVPTIDYSQTMNVVAKNVANIAIAKSMILSTISLLTEGAVLIANMVRSSGVMGAMNTLSGKLVNTLGDDSFAISAIANGEDGFGYGQHSFGATYGQHRTYDAMGNINDTTGKLSKYTEMFRDMTLHTLPFVRSSDLLERLNFQDTLDTLKGYIDGKIVFKDYELKAFAIDDKLLAKLSDNLELNSKGHVKIFDYTKWSKSEQIEFKALIDRMMMKRMNQTTMGTSSSASRQSALGIALMPMLKYPMTAYSNLGAFVGRGILQKDPFAMTQAMLWFQAGMVQSTIRGQINGTEPQSREQLLYSGWSNTPFSGAINTVVGLSNSPTSQMLSEMGSVADLYSYVDK